MNIHERPDTDIVADPAPQRRVKVWPPSAADDIAYSLRAQATPPNP